MQSDSLTTRRFGLLLAAVFAPMAAVAQNTTTPPAASSVSLIGRAVPEVSSLPPGAHKTLVEYGQQLTERTFAHIGPEVKSQQMRYAGNNLACVSCHQTGATKPFAMPWTGVTASFPQYRAREDDISTVEERVNGCMQRMHEWQTPAT